MSAMNTTLSALMNLLRAEGLLVDETSSHAHASTNHDTVVPPVTNAYGREACPISGADCDSRVVLPGHLFICKGSAFRSEYLRSALDAGAVAYLCDASHAAALATIAPGVPRIVTTDAGLRHAMALVSAEAWGHPDRDITVIGLTGTKGKSTTAYMLRSIFDVGPDGRGKSGDVASIIGSIDTYDGIEDVESHNTTPEPPDLWRHLAHARTSRHDPMVMEISSQALKYDRVRELSLSVACFLNIGRDHISPQEHPNFEDYVASKLRIFAQADTALVNLATDRLADVYAAAQRCTHIVSFVVPQRDASAGTHSPTTRHSDATTPDDVPAPSVDGHVADYWASAIRSHDGKVSFTAHAVNWSLAVRLGMPGLFNVDNALCAIAVARLMHLEDHQIQAGLARCRVPGRMELLSSPDPHVAAIVDYAHNKLSYQKFFSSVAHEFAGHRIIAVFGAPGGKAQERRQELPQEAARWADVLLFTEEDPAHERVEDINAELLAATPAGTHAESIPDRAAAITRAVEIAYSENSPALICLLAKGDETRQHEGDVFVPCETDETLFMRAMHEYATPPLSATSHQEE